MGNSQTALSGIHPFKDDSSPPDHFIPPAPIANLALPELPPALQPVTISSQMSTASQQLPQQIALAAGWSSIASDPQPEKFEELFVAKPPTPPPRRISYNEAGKPGRRLPKIGFLGRGFTSLRNLKTLPNLRTLPRMIGRPDLGKIRGFFKRKQRVVGEVYPVPPDAEKPSPPSKPEVFHEQDEFFLLRWEQPAFDGGLPIIGYIIQHLELGLPQPDMTIEKDDTQSWFSSEPGQVTSTEVLLNNLIPGTTYQFRIIAENLLGFSQPSEISNPIVFNPNGELDDWFCPPVIIVPLDDNYTAIEHERVVLVVEITGQPYPIVRWYGNEGVELGKTLDPLKYTTVSSGQRRVLTINSVECSDSGVVRCVGENERGVVECSCVVTVEAPPHIRRVLRSELIKLENPYELNKEEERLVRRQDKNDEELIFQSGELARFKFMYSGSPPPNVCVYHESDLVYGEEVAGQGRVTSDRVNTEITDNLITVKIAGVRRTDRGEWTVRLDNVLGEDSANVLITVTDRPSEPGKPDVLQLSDNTVILKWDKPFDDGGCPVSGYVVEYFRSEWGVWLKACTTRNPYTKIRDLIPGSKYMFRVKAENLYGMSNPSTESVELLITDLASTLRSVTGDGEGTLLMKTVVEEEEEAVKIEEEEPRRRRQGSALSLNRVSSGTMTDLSALGKGEGGSETTREPSASASAAQSDPQPPRTLSPHPPRSSNNTLRPDSPEDRTCQSPSRLLQVTLQPHVIVLEEEEEEEEPEEDFQMDAPSPNLIPAPPSPRRSPSPSPVAPPRTRTIIQQPTHVDEDAVALSRSQEFSSASMSLFSIQKPQTLAQPPVRPQRSSPTPTAAVQQAPPQRPAPLAQKPPITIPVVQPINEPKKLYSRAEIIRSAATNDLDYYLTLTDDNPQPEEETLEEPEEDPELLKVKEALSKDDHLFDDLEDEEDEYEYDFEKLQQEYDEDKKRGVVSRQDSGVSARSAEQGPVSRGESFNEAEEEERPQSVMSEVIPPTKHMHRMSSFERAQSEVVREKPVFEFTRRTSTEVVRVEEIENEEELVPPPVEPRRTISPSPARSMGGGGRGMGGSQSQSGSRTMLHDRFTDYIAMKASSRNKKIGSSLRSLSSSRYSSTENVASGGSRDSGRSSMVQQQEQGEKLFEKNFVWRQFDAKNESEALAKLERSVSVGGKGLSIFTSVQQRGGVGGEDPLTVEEEGGRQEETLEEMEMSDRCAFNRVLECACVSTPEIYSSLAGGSERGFSVLEHSRSESHMGASHVPDSGLKERVQGAHLPGGVDYETEDESLSYADQGLEGISEEGDVLSGDPSSGGKKDKEGEEGGVEREVPRDREDGRRLRKRVSFGSSDVEEISWDEARRRRGGRESETEAQVNEGEGEEEMEGEAQDEREVEEADAEEAEGEEEEEEAQEAEGQETGENEEEEQEGGEQEGDEQEGEELEHEAGEEQEEQEYEGEEEAYEHGDDTHPGDIELEYHPDDEFDDDGEVFEMDVEGIDPRVFSEMEEGEEDSSSGVMYVLLEPEEVKVGDLTEFDEEEEERVRDAKLESLLQKIDQFLGEEEAGGSYIEEILEEDEEGEARGGGEEVHDVGEEQEGLTNRVDSVELQGEHENAGEVQSPDEETNEPSNVPEDQTPENPDTEFQSENTQPVVESSADTEPSLPETKDTTQNVKSPDEPNQSTPPPKQEERIPPSPPTEAEILPETAEKESSPEMHEVIRELRMIESVRNEGNVQEAHLNVRFSMTDRPVSTEELGRGGIVVHAKFPEPPKTDRDTPDSSCDIQKSGRVSQQQRTFSPPPSLQVSDNSTERIEAPPPPPRPSTFSYKHYMAERQKQPPSHAAPRSSSRDSNRNTSISSLPTVKEEPANGSTHSVHVSRARSNEPVKEQPYKPNMSVYFELKPRVPATPAVTPLSLRSSTSSLLSSPPSSIAPTQELPPQVNRLPRPVFKSETEEDDPPVSIEEIRARIEQNRLELLRPLLEQSPPPPEDLPVARKRPPAKTEEQAPISPFMNYLFNASFYLMLSPIFCFVDLYFGLLCLLLVACVHFFFIRAH